MNRKNILAFALGPIFNAVLAFVSLPIIAWFFAPEDIGRNNIFQTFTSFSILVFVLGLDQAYVREYHESSNREALFRSCYLPAALILLVFILLTLPFSKNLAFLLYGSKESGWYLISVACIFIALTSRFLSLIVRMQERGLAYSASQVLPKIVLLVVLLSYVVFDAGAVYRNLLLANLASMATVLLVLVWNSRAQLIIALKESIEKEQLRRLLAFGFPLVTAGAAYWGLRATSTVIIRTSSDFAELGVYAMAMSFAGLATVFQLVFSTVWIPLVYKWVAQNEDLEKIQIVNSQVLAIICCILSIAGSFSWLVDFALPEAYSDVKYILIASMLQPLLYTISETTVVGMNIERKTGYAALIACVALAVNIVVSILLTPLFGASGASVANALAFFVFFIARTEVSSRVWRPHPRKKMYMVLCFYVGAACFTSLFGTAFGYQVSAAWFFILILTLFIFRSDLRGAFRIIFKKV